MNSNDQDNPIKIPNLGINSSGSDNENQDQLLLKGSYQED